MALFTFREKMWWKVLKYGFFLMVAWFALGLFVFSGQETMPAPSDMHRGNIILTIALGFLSFLFSKRVKPATSKEAMTYGLIWAGILLADHLLMTIANDTLFFMKNWSTYLVYLGIAAGPLFGFLKKPVSH